MKMKRYTRIFLIVFSFLPIIDLFVDILFSGNRVCIILTIFTLIRSSSLKIDSQAFARPVSGRCNIESIFPHSVKSEMLDKKLV